MGYTIEDIEKIVKLKSWNSRQKTDELLKIDCSQYCNLGLESPKSYRAVAKSTSKQIYKAIKRVDVALGSLLLGNMD